MWEYRASPIRVIDGDTVVLELDLGFSVRAEEHIRLVGVNAPELDQPGGPETKLYVSEWIAHTSGPRWPLLVRTQPNTNPEPTERRTLTRYLATVVQLDPPHRDLNHDIAVYLDAHPEWG